MNYWAKTTKEGLPGIDVPQHLLRVALVARLLAKEKGALLTHYLLKPEMISYLAGLHDIGKISQGFQSKCEAWLKQNGLLDESIRNAWQSLEQDHSKVSQFTVQRILMEQFGLRRSNAIWWAAAIGCHHGRLHYPGERGLAEKAGMSNDNWEKERRDLALRFFDMLDAGQDSASLPVITVESPELWWVAGLTSVADWIGSDENYFSPDREFSKNEITDRAMSAIENIEMRPPQVRQGLSFVDMFPKLKSGPNSLQMIAHQYIRVPGIYAIEAPMGMGKTEASLAVSYNLLCAGMASGIYFALPTQATSNRIHLRLADFVQSICPDSPSTRLIHSNSWLMEELTQPQPSITSRNEEDARSGRDWFASSKRALIAPFGVGTVDQALLSVVAAKHFFVRRFALAGKVVVIDEVHSYDVYTGTLIGTLCAELVKLGCTVILLSATLTRKRRNALLQITDISESDEITEPYPLVSGLPTESAPLEPVTTGALPPKKVAIKFISDDEARLKAVELTRKGACILWVCTTVARAQKAYRCLRDLTCGSVTLGLLHARFPFFQRQDLEEHWMTALSKEGPRPNGCILVSTQIVEQSVDLDADLIITELAPTDMLLQRMGRLWRHERVNRPLAAPEFCIVREERTLEELHNMTAGDIKKVLDTKAKVYAPYVLLRSLEVWMKIPDITLPKDIRPMLEETYSDSDSLPESWIELRNEIEGEGYARRIKAEMSANIINLALPDEEGVQTRLNTVEMVSLILTKGHDGKSVTLLNKERCRLDDEDFRIDIAKALHRNLVRVPEWIFAKFQKTESTSRYVKGRQAVAVIEDNGNIRARGLKQEVRLRWDEDYGIEILKDKGGDNESCD